MSLLHLPTTRLTPRHFLSAGRTGDVPRRMVAAAGPVAAGAHDIAWMSAEPQPVQVFDHDVHTVFLATDPTAVPTALRQVPPHRRPDLDGLGQPHRNGTAAVTVDHWVPLFTDQAPPAGANPSATPGTCATACAPFTISRQSLLAGDLDRVERLRPTRR
ncbi:hypothetical protein ABZV75_11495 [Streptomyces flaveolus]|uniref:hypothetical protein n=1 Tax=Streptomyces flaveolus TaxID=67297 RepID=UPI0033B0F222